MKLSMFASIALAIGFSTCAPAQTRSALQGQINQTIGANGVGAITGPVMNTDLTSMINAFGVLQDSNYWTGTNTFANSLVLPTGSIPGLYLAPGAAAVNGALPHAATNAILSAMSTTLYPGGLVRDGVLAAGDAPQQFYIPSSSCPFNSGVANGGSCIGASDGRFWVIQGFASANAADWGFSPTATAAANSTALTYYLNDLCSAGNHTGAIPAGVFNYNGVNLTLVPGAKCTVNGAGPLQTELFQNSATASDWVVTGSGSQQFVLTNMYLHEKTPGFKMAGYAIELHELYYPQIDNVTITGFNGIDDVASATMLLKNVNLGQMNGNFGINFIGSSPSISIFGAILDNVTGSNSSGTPNNTLIWLNMDSYAYSVDVKYAAFQWGGICERMTDSLNSGASGTASAPLWLFNQHLECDHNFQAIDLQYGSGFTLAPGSWVGSSRGGPGILQEAGWGTGIDTASHSVPGSVGGQSVIDGVRINANSGDGVELLGGIDTKIVNNTITANGSDEIYVAQAAQSGLQIRGNTISQYGDGDSSTDSYCINLISGGTPVNVDVSYNKDMRCVVGSVSNLLRGASVTMTGNDNFNQGTFTPTMRGSGTAGTFTLGTAAGYYSIVDGRVFTDIDIIITSVSGSPTTQLLISGLPFATSLTGTHFSACNISSIGSFTLDSGYTQFGAAAIPNSFSIAFYEIGSGQTQTFLPPANVNTGGAAIQLSCSYSVVP